MTRLYPTAIVSLRDCEKRPANHTNDANRSGFHSCHLCDSRAKFPVERLISQSLREHLVRSVAIDSRLNGIKACQRCHSPDSGLSAAHAASHSRFYGLTNSYSPAAACQSMVPSPKTTASSTFFTKPPARC